MSSNWKVRIAFFLFFNFHSTSISSHGHGKFDECSSNNCFFLLFSILFEYFLSLTYKYFFLITSSIAKDYEISRRLLSKRNLKRDMDPFIQVLPVLKAVLNVCEIVETRLKSRSNSEPTLDSGPETRNDDTVELKSIDLMLTDTAILSAAACR